MKKIVTASILLISLYCLISCTNKSKDKLIVGKWSYEKFEAGPKTPEEGAIRIETNNKGRLVVFDSDKKYVSLGSQGDTTETGSYELTGEGKFMVMLRNGSTKAGDTIKVVELTDKTFKIQSPKDDVVTFKRVQ